MTIKNKKKKKPIKSKNSIKKYKDKIKNLEDKLFEVNEKSLRLLAEFENFKKWILFSRNKRIGDYLSFS